MGTDAGLKKRDTVGQKDNRPRGILNLKADESMTGHRRYRPSEDLAHFVEHCWIVEWDVREPEVAETLPHPSVHLVLEAGRSGGLRRGHGQAHARPRRQGTSPRGDVSTRRLPSVCHATGLGLYGPLGLRASA